ncbi:hypothetical protein PPSIR1_29026 [Plesiocystis pacifica SIR-1]|uniref:Lipoprotein n=1 Tax=Plesiocystis pacifica SIR-1 TaxID=391625 RepID=A6GEZ3_9BACT|nr:hypothetical protein [Plesiocystis pacifica]EDM75585.1 hypothetical protein PPSIR1_29026 [Plesiocystis pacifica SIR-1]
MSARATTVALACAALVLGACEGKQTEPGTGAPVELKQPAPPLPQTRAEFLAEVYPLPEGAPGLELRYEVRGEVAEGTYLIQMKPGGYRRESWKVRWQGIDNPMADEEAVRPLISEGATLVTPSHIWTARKGDPGELRSNHLETFASAWYSLADDQKASTMAAIREWQSVLAKERLANPGELATVHGVSCLQTRIAAQNLCMWEEAGVFLRYEGAVFNVELVSLDRNPELDEDLFEIPVEAASRAERVEVEPLAHEAILDELTQGKYEAMTGLVAPGTLDALGAMQPPKPKP